MSNPLNNNPNPALLFGKPMQNKPNTNQYIPAVKSN